MKPGLPFRWFTADEGYGDNDRLRWSLNTFRACLVAVPTTVPERRRNAARRSLDDAVAPVLLITSMW